MPFNKFGSDEDFAEWSRSINRMLDEIMKRNFVQFRRSGCWRPAADVYEDDQSYLICLELPGVDPNVVNVDAAPHRLVVWGERGRPASQHGGKLSVQQLEIEAGAFRREFSLSCAVAVEGVAASYVEGYLWITLPKTRSR